MYYNNINLNLTFLGFFFITNVFGAPGAWHQSLKLNAKLHRERDNITFSKILPQLRKNVNEEVTENNTIALGYNYPSDDPKFGKLENLLF